MARQSQGENVMSTSTWTGAVNSDWDNPDNWSPAGVPGVNSDVTIATGDAVASASIGTVNSIDSSDLDFRSAGTNTVATFVDNTGHLHVDAKGGAGGTILNIGGALTNSGDLVIGNAALSAPDEVAAASVDNRGGGSYNGRHIILDGSSANQALLDVSGAAGFGVAGVLSGHVRLTGDSAIEFASGEITSLANFAHLGLNGTDAFIEDSTAQGSNSALTGLARIGGDGGLELENGASVSTTGSLVILSDEGHIRLDTGGGDGGSSLNIGGRLTSSGSLTIGNATLSASDEMTAESLDNKGSISLTGSSSNQALLDVTAGSAGFGTAGVLSGDVQLAGDSAIEFASGQITSLAASAQLRLNGNDGFLEDSTALGSNSALTGLASIGSGATFDLDDGAAVSTTGALANDGTVFLDYFGEGGSSLTVAGTLTNRNTLVISTLSSSDKVTAASLDNTGLIQLTGSGANQALLDVTAGSAGFGTAGVLSGDVQLAGDSAIEFASGQITSLVASRYASAILVLYGNNAFIEDSTALGSNSALMGLASIGGGAFFELENGAAVSTTGALANDGNIVLDANAGGGSSLTVGGTLTNDDGGSLYIGNRSLSSSDSVTANSFVNSGLVDLIGSRTELAALNVSGTTTNNGAITIATDTEELAGAVSGTGSLELKNANLQFDSSVSSGQTITEKGADTLTLNEAQNFAATISGFGTHDTIDATNFVETGTTYNFVENPAMTGGTLTLADTSLSLTANILMTGHYTNSDFTLAPDSGTGTLVKFV
jgi:hypothetical protein